MQPGLCVSDKPQGPSCFGPRRSWGMQPRGPHCLHYASTFPTSSSPGAVAGTQQALIQSCQQCVEPHIHPVLPGWTHVHTVVSVTHGPQPRSGPEALPHRALSKDQQWSLPVSPTCSPHCVDNVPSRHPERKGSGESDVTRACACAHDPTAVPNSQTIIGVCV